MNEQYKKAAVAWVESMEDFSSTVYLITTLRSKLTPVNWIAKWYDRQIEKAKVRVLDHTDAFYQVIVQTKNPPCKGEVQSWFVGKPYEYINLATDAIVTRDQSLRGGRIPAMIQASVDAQTAFLRTITGTEKSK